MKLIGNSIGACIVFLLTVGTAFSDDCDSILDKALLDQSMVVDKNAAVQAAKNSYCSKTYKEMQESGSFSANGEYGWGFIGGGADSSQSGFDSWKQENCGDSTSAQSSDIYHFAAQKALSVQAVSAWRDCKMRTNNLSCFAEPNNDPDIVNLVVSWRPEVTKKTIVTKSLALNALNQSENTLRNKIYNSESKINSGSDVVVFKREKKGSVDFSLSIEYDGDLTKSCSVYVPATADAPIKTSSPNKDFVLTGKWCPLNTQMPPLEIAQFGSSFELLTPDNTEGTNLHKLFKAITIEKGTKSSIILNFTDETQMLILTPDPCIPKVPGHTSSRIQGKLNFKIQDENDLIFNEGSFTAEGGPKCEMRFLPVNTVLHRCG